MYLQTCVLTAAFAYGQHSTYPSHFSHRSGYLPFMSTQLTECFLISITDEMALKWKSWHLFICITSFLLQTNWAESRLSISLDAISVSSEEQFNLDILDGCPPGFYHQFHTNISADDNGMCVTSSGWRETNQNGLIKREKAFFMVKKLSGIFPYCAFIENVIKVQHVVFGAT